MEEAVLKPCQVALKNWSDLFLDGVKNIISLDDELITLDTDRGAIYIEGNGMRIEFLNENGEIGIKGSIKGIFSVNERQKRKGGLRGLFGG